MKNELPYRVKCKSTYPFFELIAAFDTEQAALTYAGNCALANTKYRYRVSCGRRTILEFGPDEA